MAKRQLFDSKDRKTILDLAGESYDQGYHQEESTLEHDGDGIVVVPSRGGGKSVTEAIADLQADRATVVAIGQQKRGAPTDTG